jgi:hypothetical protein
MRTALIAIVAMMTVANFGAQAASYKLPPLIIGYEGEGKVAVSPEDCLKFVEGTTQWTDAQTKESADKVCKARKRHKDAHDALEAAYQTFRMRSTDKRLDIEQSVSQFRTMMKSCIDHKLRLTTGGHNIMIDIIPNEIAASCLEIGAQMLSHEAVRPYQPW